MEWKALSSMCVCGNLSTPPFQSDFEGYFQVSSPGFVAKRSAMDQRAQPELLRGCLILS